MKTILFFLFSFCSLCSSAQFCEQDTIFKKVKEPKELKATVTGNPFLRTLRISKDSLKKDFTIVLEDSSYQFTGGLLTYLFEGGSLCLPLFGNKIDTEDLDFFKELRANEFLSFDELVVEKNGRRFKIPSFFIAVTE